MPASALRPNPPLSGIIRTLSTPTASRPARTRFKMFTFSWLGTNRPWATILLISFPAAGLAMMPTLVKFRLRVRNVSGSFGAALPFDSKSERIVIEFNGGQSLLRGLFDSVVSTLHGLRERPPGQVFRRSRRET